MLWGDGQHAARLPFRGRLPYGDYEQATANKRTRRKRFLGEMEKVVP
jgi:hypothetical protein